MVFGHNRPAVFLRAFLDLFAARVDHRLDGEGHAHFELFQRARFAVMQHLGLFMKDLPNAVAAKLAHHAEAVAFGKFLNRRTNVT